VPQIPVDQVVIIIAAIAAPVFTAGAAWAAVKGALNGMRGDVRQLVASDANQNERLARIEEKVDAYGGWIRRVEDTANEAWERRREARE